MTIEIRPRESAPVSKSAAPASPTVRVLICGDQPLYRAALASLIETSSVFRTVRDTTLAPSEIAAALASVDVDLVLIDFDANGDAECRMLKDILDVVAPRPTVVVTTGMDSDACQAAIERGISGIVFKANGAEVLHSAMDNAQRGQVFLDRELLSEMFDNTAARRRTAGEQSKIAQLTPREREIFHIAITGITNKQIGEQLSISEATVRHHLGSIFGKLGVSTRSELVVYGYRHKLAVPHEAQ
jgi:two-component system, NarL family, nitrate/nitrite response regulator NarL